MLLPLPLEIIAGVFNLSSADPFDSFGFDFFTFCWCSCTILTRLPNFFLPASIYNETGWRWQLATLLTVHDWFQHNFDPVCFQLPVNSVNSKRVCFAACNSSRRANGYDELSQFFKKRSTAKNRFSSDSKILEVGRVRRKLRICCITPRQNPSPSLVSAPWSVCVWSQSDSKW